MQPYAKNKKIWICPSDNIDAEAKALGLGGGSVAVNSYWLNAYIFRWSGATPTALPSVTLAEINYPGDDHRLLRRAGERRAACWPGPPYEWCGARCPPAWRHNSDTAAASISAWPTATPDGTAWSS